MTTIYLDAGALMIPSGAGAEGILSVGSDAARMVDHLLSFGHGVVLLGEGEKLEVARASLSMAGGPAVVERETTLGSLTEDASGWLITDDPELCASTREHRRIKTVLIGASTASHDLAHRPADRLARSLGEAVLDILATEAMPESAPPPEATPSADGAVPDSAGSPPDEREPADPTTTR